MTDEAPFPPEIRALSQARGRDGSAVPLSPLNLQSFALTAILSIGAQAVYSRDDARGGPDWQRYPGSGQEAGHAEWASPYGGHPWSRGFQGGESPGLQDPSWGYGEPSGSGLGGAGFGDYREDDPYALGQGGSSPPLGPVPPRSNPGPGFEQAPTAVYPSPYAHDYRTHYQFPSGGPWGLSDGPGLGSGSNRLVPSPGLGDPAPEVYPGYRFRGDPPAHPGQWPSAPYGTVYRFRPLTEQERGRWGQVPEHRPGYPEGRGGFPLRGDPSLQPETAYGFEPNLWRTR